jgi:hypothetical protein
MNNNCNSGHLNLVVEIDGDFDRPTLDGVVKDGRNWSARVTTEEHLEKLVQFIRGNKLHAAGRITVTRR